eukprot:1634632-Prymnesium_polylepis.1
MKSENAVKVLSTETCASAALVRVDFVAAAEQWSCWLPSTNEGLAMPEVTRGAAETMLSLAVAA